MVISVCSGKGGAGKSFVTSNLSAALCKNGKQVLAIDGDAGLKNLDIFFGIAENVVFDYYDVILGRCSLETAILPIECVPGLYFLSAPTGVSSGEIKQNRWAEVIFQAKSLSCFDYILIDCPAGICKTVITTAKCADLTLIITGLDPLSLRDAQNTAIRLWKEEVESLRLVVNRVDKRLINKKIAPNIDDIIDLTGVQLIGTIPIEPKALLFIQQGILPVTKKSGSKTKAAFNSLADILIDFYI